jgi:hypothetical protein
MKNLFNRKDENTMKATTLQSFLEECRAASTSDAIGAVVDQIETMIAASAGERAKLDGQLGEAVVAGRDPGKIHTAIAQLNQDVMTLEAARAGFSQKQVDVLKQEERAALDDLKRRYEAIGAELEADVKDAAAMVEAARIAFAKVADTAKRRGRMFDEPASAIMRNAIGEIRRGDGVTEYGRRVDIGFAEILADNPSIMRRAQVMRRGRVGETNQARDMATEGWMKLANGNGG